MIRSLVLLAVLAAGVIPGQTPQAGGPPGMPPQPEFVRQGMRLMREGKSEEALALYRKQLEAAPDSPAAHNALGNLLDLMGRGQEARQYFAKAIDKAPSPQARAAAQRSMAMSYAFENDCANTVKFEQMVFDYWRQEKNFYQQGEMANEAARVCKEAGDLDTALRWYRTGTEVGLQEPGISPDRAALWKFRLQHALARVAARRGNAAEARKHVAEARAILDANPGMAKAQEIFYPYLTGYVALYSGEYSEARDDLRKANQNDPFIQCLIGQAEEHLGHSEEALSWYRKAAQAAMHNPPAAYAHWFTRKKLAGK